MNRSGSSVAVVVPATESVSNASENFSSASTPHALATVVFQWPFCIRPSEPRTSRGMSSRHAGASRSASSNRLALESAEIISHHSASVFSVEKPIVVPWKFRRERRICSASFIRSSRFGTFGERLSTRYQSSTAEVGHRLGSMAMLSSHLASIASLRRDSASSAAILRMARSAVCRSE